MKMFSEWVHEKYPHVKVSYPDQKWMSAIGDGEGLRFLKKSDSMLGKLLVEYFYEKDYGNRKGIAKWWYYLTRRVLRFR